MSRSIPKSVAQDGAASNARDVTESERTVFTYDDYHAYLRDWVAACKLERSSFSYQELANRLGLKSKSSLRLVCVGQRDLSAAAVN